MNQLWQLLGVFGIGAGLITAAIAFVSKAALETWMNSKIESFRARLEREAEEHRVTLQRAAKEHEIRFTRLHERRAEVIAEVYELLQTYWTSFGALATNSDPNVRARLEKRHKGRYYAFARYFSANAIWLDPDLCDQIFHKIIGPMHRSFTLLEGAVPPDEAAVEDARRVATDEIPRALDALNQAFRQILGVVPSATAVPVPAPPAHLTKPDG